MKIYYGFKNIPLQPRSIAIGVFDGVHLGHQKILNAMLKCAKRHRLMSMAVTFEPHPNKILRPTVKHSILMSLEHRLRFFEKMGVSETLVIRFNKKFSKISHHYFLQQLLCYKLGMKYLSVGENFRFGFQGFGNSDYLLKESKRLRFGLSLISPVRDGDVTISSTRIRTLIEKGDLKKPQKMLGRPVSVYGTVVQGKGRGRSLKFPTANLNPHHETLPPNGVYAAWGSLGNAKLKAVIHIGGRPTFQERQKSLEAHFLNFHRNIYGREIELFFVAKLRGIKKFPGREALIQAIKDDIQKTLRIL